MQHASHFNQLPKSFADNRKRTTGRLAMSTWKMAHRHLVDRHAKPGCLSENFRVDHRAYRLDLDTFEYVAIEDLERAVNVTDPDPEQEPHEDIPTPSKQQSMRRVLPPGSVAGHNVVVIGLFEKRRH